MVVRYPDFVLSRGNIREEVGIQAMPPFDKPETVQDHGPDPLSVAEEMLPGLGGRPIDHCLDP